MAEAFGQYHPFAADQNRVMVGAWVMTKRKRILVGSRVARDNQGGEFLKKDYRVFDIGDKAPKGTKDKPYTRYQQEKE